MAWIKGEMELVQTGTEFRYKATCVYKKQPFDEWGMTEEIAVTNLQTAVQDFIDRKIQNPEFEIEVIE